MADYQLPAVVVALADRGPTVQAGKLPRPVAPGLAAAARVAKNVESVERRRLISQVVAPNVVVDILRRGHAAGCSIGKQVFEVGDRRYRRASRITVLRELGRRKKVIL